MTTHANEPQLSATADLSAETSVNSFLDSITTLASSVGIKTESYDNLLYVARYVGESSGPQDVRRLRHQVYDMMRRMGQPVIIKKMLTIKDVENGFAERSANYSNVYGQTRNNDNLSWGTGFVSKEKSENEWINPNDGEIVQSKTSPSSGWEKAPKYRGFGPGVVTYLIQPDAPQDYFTLTPTGAMIQVQTADVSMAWFPKVNDNDLIINVELDEYGHVQTSGRRYQAKMTNPVTIRGLDRRGRREYEGDFGNRHVVNQTYQITLVPENNILMKVETDR
jgi:hypothetical protein